MDRATQIAILETAFEPHGEGFLFYKDRYSSGFPVSAEERDVFLTKTGFWEHRKWVEAVVRRSPAAPPRDGYDANRRLRAAMPQSFIWLSLAFAVLFIAQALGSGIPTWQRVAWLIAGLFFGGSGIANIVARWQTRRAG